MKKVRFNIIFLLLTFLIVSCATVKEAPEPPLSPVQQQAKAMEKFTSMLEDSRAIPTPDSRVDMEEGYYEIIDKYPESLLAEEAHYRLIRMFYRDYSPPRFDDADKIYNDFFDKYPNSRFSRAVNEDISMLLYRGEYWERLLVFTVPFMEELVKTGKYGKSLYLFYYSEAKYQTGDFSEAFKGFEKVLVHYRNESFRVQAKQRLKHLRRFFSQRPQGVK
jgi:hypothetical protein